MDNSPISRTIKINEIYYMQIFVKDKGGNGKPGLKISYFIYQAKGGYLRKKGCMIEDYTRPGVYVQSYIFNKLGQFRIIYKLPSGYEDIMEIIYVKDDQKERTIHRHYYRNYARSKSVKVKK